MKKVIFFIIAILLLIAVPVTVYMIGTNQELRSKAAPATSLALNPSSITKKVGDIFSLEVQIDTGGNNVALAELHLVYDATKLEAQSITNGPLAPRIAASGVVGAGTVSITVGANSSAQPIKGTGTIAIVRFRSMVPTGDVPIQVKFDSTTYVSGLNEKQPNVLVNTSPASVSIIEDSPTTPVIQKVAPQEESPSPTPLATPTLSSLPAATDSAMIATSSGILTVSLQEGATESATSRPVIQGKAPPGSTVTIVIHSSETITAIVTADENGNFVYTPTTDLSDGSHQVIASTQTSSGAVTSSMDFTVMGASTEESTMDAMPVSGSISMTLLPLFIGICFVIAGMFFRWFWVV